MVLEEVARGWATLSAPVSAQAIAGSIVARYGNRHQRGRLVPPMTRGERRAVLVPGEAVRALRHGDRFSLSGSATLVPGAEHADFYIVSTRAADGSLECFLVERDAHRLALWARHDTLGGRGLEACDLMLVGVEVVEPARLATRA